MENLTKWMKKSYTDLGGQKIAWSKFGTGRPLLLLHGWGSSSDVMSQIAERIGAYRTCYLLDFPGFGNSPEPSKGWSIGDYADLTSDFIHQILPEDQPVDILAHSFGGRVSIKLLSNKQNPVASRIDKVIFTGAAGLKPKRSASFYVKKYTAKTLKAPFALLPETLRNAGLNQLRQTSLWKKLGSGEYRELTGSMRETFVKTVTEYLEKDVQEISHEILLIWGEKDTATPLEQGERMDQLLKQSALVTIPDAGHYAFLDKPAQFAAIVKSYLTS